MDYLYKIGNRRIASIFFFNKSVSPTTIPGSYRVRIFQSFCKLGASSYRGKFQMVVSLNRKVMENNDYPYDGELR